MDLPRLEAMNRYWEDHPPVHVLVGAYFGLGGEEKTTDNDDFLAMFPQTHGPAGPPVL